MSIFSNTVRSQMNSRDGFFLLGREAQPSFQWRDLVGKRLIRFAEVPTPWMCLQHVLRQAGVAPQAVRVRDDLTTAEAVSAFKRGEADYLQQGQPVVERLVREGHGVVIAAQGDAVGAIPFSTYLTTPSVIQQHAEVLHRFTRVFYRAQQWLAQHTASEIARLIAPSFPDLSEGLCSQIIERYLRQQTWACDPLIRPAGFDRLQAIFLAAGHITRRYAYREHVDVSFAKAAYGLKSP